MSKEEQPTRGGFVPVGDFPLETCPASECQRAVVAPGPSWGLDKP